MSQLISDGSSFSNRARRSSIAPRARPTASGRVERSSNGYARIFPGPSAISRRIRRALDVAEHHAAGILDVAPLDGEGLLADPPHDLDLLRRHDTALHRVDSAEAHEADERPVVEERRPLAAERPATTRARRRGAGSRTSGVGVGGGSGVGVRRGVRAGAAAPARSEGGQTRRHAGTPAARRRAREKLRRAGGGGALGPRQGLEQPAPDFFCFRTRIRRPERVEVARSDRIGDWRIS